MFAAGTQHNGGAGQGANWTLTPASGEGSLSNYVNDPVQKTSQITYTAPAASCSNCVTITATSIANPAASDSWTFSIAGPALNAAFAKTWTGTTTTTAGGQTFTGNNGHLTITVSGNNATLSTVCPDASGSVNATGSGNSASWSGTLACPPVQPTGCSSSLILTYTTAMLALSSDNQTPAHATLTVHAGGTVSGCTFNNTPFTTTFVGT